MGKLFKREIGITLIALVITIIVLLILAGVVIATLTGDNGILQKAGEAKIKTTDAQVEEQVELTYLEFQAENYMNPTVDVANAIKTKLKTIYGNDLDESSVKLENGILTATIYGISYSYNTETGVSGRTADQEQRCKISLSQTSISYDDFVQLGNGVFVYVLTATVDDEYADSELIWQMDSPDTTNLFFDQTSGYDARIETLDKRRYGDITITVRINGTNEVATCTLDTSSGSSGPM